MHIQSHLNLGKDLEPVTVRIDDEVNAHGRVFEADAAHLFMQSVSSFIVAGMESQMELTLSEVIFLRMVAQPRQLKFEISLRRAHIDENKGTVGGFFSADFLHAERLLVESNGCAKVGHVIVLVDHGKGHVQPSLRFFQVYHKQDGFVKRLAVCMTVYKCMQMCYITPANRLQSISSRGGKYMMGSGVRLRRKLIGDRAFYAQVIAIVVPIIIQNTVSNVVNLLDNVMVGRVGSLQMSAVAIVNQLIFIFNLCIFGGLAGAGIFATQFAGAKDNEGVRHCFRVKVMIAAAMMVCALIVFLSVPRELIGMFLAEGTSPADYESTMGFSLDYLYVMLFGLLPFAVSQVYASTLREVGETKLPMAASVVAILVNLVFNYLLIFGKFGFPQLGVTGAALATVLSRYVEMSIILIYTHIRSADYAFICGAYRSMHVPRMLMKDIVRRGMPLLVNEFFWSVGMAMLLQCYSVRGLDVVAASNIASTVGNLFKVIFLSMGSAVAIMLGQALGANCVDEAKDTFWKLAFLSFAINVVMAFALALVSEMIPQIYNTEEHVRHMATQMLLANAVMMPIHSFSHCCYFTIRSGGRTIITFLFDSGFTWLLAFPVAYILANLTTMPIVPLYFIVQAIEIVKAAAGFVLVRKGIWIRNIVGAAPEGEAAC